MIKQYLLIDDYDNALVFCENLIKNNPNNLDYYWYLGLIYLLMGKESSAENIWMSVIFDNVENIADISNNLVLFLDNYGVYQLEENKINNAIKIYHKIQEIEPNYITLSLEFSRIINQWINEAINLTKNHLFNPAKTKYQLIIQFETNNALIWHNLALVYYELLEYQQGYQAIINAINLDPSNFLYYFYAGIFLEKTNYSQDAILFYQKAINLNPNHIDSYNNLGNIFIENNQLKEAEKCYKLAIKIDNKNYGTYINLGNLYLKQGKIDESLGNYQQAIILNNDEEIYFWIVNNIRSFNYIQEAIKFAKDNSKFFPNNLLINLVFYSILPYIYQQESDINYYRNNVTYFLEKISTALTVTSESNKKSALKIIDLYTNYHLNYQAQNDLYLQSLYGNFIHEVMKANYPQYCQPIKNKLTLNDGKIKVGYISYCLRSHVVGKLSLGWIKYHNKESFDVYCYYLGDFLEDKITLEFKQHSTKFYHFSDRLSTENIAQQIRENDLDILVFLDLSMYPRMSQLAGLRLAKIQCTTWLHPITSGIPTIDYFISSELIEKEKAENHYSETLIKLSNLSIVYAQKDIPKVNKDRSKFYLKDNNIIYITSQFPSKYLPQYDYIYPEIAMNINDCQFVFIHPKVNQNNEQITNELWRRIKKNFTKYGLNWQNYCIFLPTINNSEDYWQLFTSCDIFLDTIGFTGFNSTLDALESFLPVVTYSGDFFRTRQSEGILKMIQVIDTIAKNEQDYLKIAIELGINSKFRESIVNKIKQNIRLVYDDLTPIKALENFYHNIII
ncbi:tetratricopeptide repeat protein [Geminocystis sp. NIES-3709]|uniref:O-linked N-acetylglucosamine transferase family protein n=1 Tax=Geminocystis sp. NIES-3709 TaxID=1617448 RepID=UPI0005FC9239|nr:tetratricopeptide repeat protein [Geminocystis sp. NIES-3709]BAQ63702.1 hypothetical protein GM3709_467 [Geminocystis sp. NIES-3709]